MAGKKTRDKGEASKEKGAEPKERTIIVPRLQERYRQQVLPALQEKLGRKNPMSLPRLEKIVVNMGVGAATQDKKVLEVAVEALTEITGQKPIITLARKSVAGFRLREGQAIGCKVTLRRQRMYEFLDRLGVHRTAPGSGLSRDQPDGFRPAGELQLGIGGTTGVSRTESGQVRQGPRIEYHGGDDSDQRRRGAGAADADGIAVSARRFGAA